MSDYLSIQKLEKVYILLHGTILLQRKMWCVNRNEYMTVHGIESIEFVIPKGIQIRQKKR